MAAGLSAAPIPNPPLQGRGTATVAPVKPIAVAPTASLRNAAKPPRLPARSVALQPVMMAKADLSPARVAPGGSGPGMAAIESAFVSRPPIRKNRVLEPGDSDLLNQHTQITRTQVSDPEILDVVPVSTSEVVVNAKKEGKATVRVWDKDGLITYTYTVRRAPTPQPTEEEIRRLIGVPTISARIVGDTVLLMGTAPSADAAHRAEGIAAAFGKKVTNLVTVETVGAENVVVALRAALKDVPLQYEMLADETIMINGTVATEEEAARVKDVLAAWIGTQTAVGERPAVSTSTQVTFGARQEPAPDVIDKAHVEARQVEPGNILVSQEYNVARHVFAGRVPNGPRILALLDVNPAIARQIVVSAQVIEVDSNRLKDLGVEWGSVVGDELRGQPFVVVEDRPGPVSLDEGGPLRRLPFNAQIRALIEESAARILSEPKVLIADGHPANIHVGGEIPIPVSQSSGVGSTSISVLWKPFGIQLTVRPRITPDDRILMTVTPEVSDLDFANGVRAADIEIPAVTVRRATTTVHVNNAEPLAIGGLMASRDSDIVRRIPLLSQIPVIGELFKSKSKVRRQTELIIVVTPRIVEAGAPVPIAQPGEKQP